MPNNRVNRFQRPSRAGSRVSFPPRVRQTNGPAQFESNVRFGHKYRFVSTSAFPTNITARDLIQSCGVVAATSVLGYSIATAVRIKRVELWAPPASLGAAATVSLFWLSQQTSNYSELEVSDTTMSTATPAHLTSSPPLLSLASFWQTDSTTNLCTLTVPVGGVIDIWLEMVLGDGLVTIQPSPLVLVGATAGALYYEPLDGRGGVYTPVSLTTN